jgi:(p)ppGpp synthase/HD superfamily hydrolase
VEVLTGETTSAKIFWIDHVCTPKARIALHNYYNKIYSQLAVHVGKAILQHAFPNVDELVSIPLLKERHIKTKEELYEKIGRGEISLTEFIAGVKKPSQRPFFKEIPFNLLKWVLGYREARAKIKIAPAKVSLDFKDCCQVLIGKESVLGYLEDNKAVIHDAKCKFLDSRTQERTFYVLWDMEEEQCSL